MAYTTDSVNTRFSIFPSSPASFNTSVLFSHAQLPRDNHATYNDLCQVFGCNNRRTRTISQSEEAEPHLN